MTDIAYKLNDTVTVLLADTDLVKGILQDLVCISHSGATQSLGDLRARAGDDRTALPHGVHPDAVRYILKMIPLLPDTVPVPEPAYGYRYRIGVSALHAAWELLDRSAQHRLAGGDDWLPRDVAGLVRVGHALYGDRWQSDLARALGVNDRRLRAWMQGERKPPVGIWGDIAGLLRQRNQEGLALLRELEQAGQ
ncbi:hypothetical protein [Xanthomonas axonopodis]|uniref:hypothetical protein n=1 Tax=Xanthomonas axonopodis TaxID=53413 RepID=UPI000D4356F8|nr:hypothetical protein [Xanthomonas axonopodis]PPV06801.1 hypothetical protein XavaCFBP5823_19575 [Xanthomonas axonopodis pv. vasculorum]